MKLDLRAAGGRVERASERIAGKLGTSWLSKLSVCETVP